MSDLDHAPDCALVQYPGRDDQRCDCEASDPPPGLGPEPVEDAIGPTLQLVGSQASALLRYRAAVVAAQKAIAARDKALAVLTEELTR
jgi:hypothetical protein